MSGTNVNAAFNILYQFIIAEELLVLTKRSTYVGSVIYVIKYNVVRQRDVITVYVVNVIRVSDFLYYIQPRASKHKIGTYERVSYQFAS